MIFLCPLVSFLHAMSLLDISFMTIINKTSVFLCFVISILYLCDIVLLPQRWCGMTLSKKVLLKLSSNIKFSQSLNGTKMIAVAPHHLIHTRHNRCGLLSYWCGLLSYLFHWQCEKPDIRIRQI